MRYVESLNRALHGVMRDDLRVYLIGEDVLDPYGGAFKVARGLSTAFPERVLTTPISEAAITGFAIGLAMRGLRPVVEIMFGDFLTLAADQLINHATKFRWMYNEQVAVPLVVRAPMGGRRGYGPTHSQCLEKLYFGVPGLTIVAPSDWHDPGLLLRRAILEDAGVTLFIEGKTLYPQTLKEPDSRSRADDFWVRSFEHADRRFPTLVLGLTAEQRADVALVAYGVSAPLVVEAAKRLLIEDEILAEVVLPSLVVPWPVEDLLPSALKAQRMVVVEEGGRTAGWGAELAALISDQAFGKLLHPVVRIGALDCPIPSARSLEDDILPSVEDIVRAVRAMMGR